MNVWGILRKDKYTEEGQQYFEQLGNILDNINNKLNLEELEALYIAMDEHLYEILDLVAIKCIERKSKLFIGETSDLLLKEDVL